jgi:hypothetical protein
LLSCKVTRKKFFGFSYRFLYVFVDTIIINKEALRKKPDRVFPYRDLKRVVWKYGDEKEKKSQQVSVIV